MQLISKGGEDFLGRNSPSNHHDHIYTIPYLVSVTKSSEKKSTHSSLYFTEALFSITQNDSKVTKTQASSFYLRAPKTSFAGAINVVPTRKNECIEKHYSVRLLVKLLGHGYCIDIMMLIYSTHNTVVEINDREITKKIRVPNFIP